MNPWPTPSRPNINLFMSCQTNFYKVAINDRVVWVYDALHCSPRSSNSRSSSNHPNKHTHTCTHARTHIPSVLWLTSVELNMLIARTFLETDYRKHRPRARALRESAHYKRTLAKKNKKRMKKNKKKRLQIIHLAHVTHLRAIKCNIAAGAPRPCTVQACGAASYHSTYRRGAAAKRNGTGQLSHGVEWNGIIHFAVERLSHWLKATFVDLLFNCLLAQNRY